MKNTRIWPETINTCLHSVFEEIVEKFPHKTAIRFDDKILSYSELNNYANNLAHKIIDHIGYEPGNVAILIENSSDQIIAILAILKSGKAYVPLDINFPAARNKNITDDANCELIISNRKYHPHANELVHENKIILADENLSFYPGVNPEISISPDTLALIPYTSGSTGKPKGAKHIHKNLVHMVKRIMNDCPVEADDVFAYYLSVAFSAHAVPLFMALLNGCTLVVMDIKSNNFSGFLDRLKNEKVNVILMIPSFIRHLLAVIENLRSLQSIKYLIVAGESFYRSDFEKLKKVLSTKAQIINVYGSTEAYITCSYKMDHDTVLKGNYIPAGKAVDGIEIKIIDDKGKPVADDTTGKIQIISKYITTGYWNDDLNKNTIRRSEDDDETITFNTSDIGFKRDDGCIVLVGREDNFTKLRGYRIDLCEIENILLEDNNLREVACVVRKDPAGSEKIIAYLVSVNDTKLNVKFLKDKLIRLLPDYMIPSYFVVLNDLPKTSTGKRDVKNVPDPPWDNIQTKKDIVTPRNTLEKELVDIFKASLKIKSIGVRNNFVESGADSLSLFVIITKIEKKYNVKLDIDAIVKEPTIESIAKFIDENI